MSKTFFLGILTYSKEKWRSVKRPAVRVRWELEEYTLGAPIVWIEAEPVPGDCGQAVKPCVHAGFSAYKSDALAVAVQFHFPRSLLDMLCPAFRFCVLDPADTSAEILCRSLCGAGTVPAAILSFFPCID